MSGIYPQGAVPSYRSSNQTVIVHHWSAAIPLEQVRHDLTPDRDDTPELLDTVIPYNAECSLPIKVVVRESDNSFSVEEVPTQCPLCERKFSTFDLKRIRGAAVSQHLRVCDWKTDQIVHPTDLILDV